MSPFFEPDRKHPEDPALAPGDGSIFARLLEDFTFDAPKNEPPVHVFFRHREGRTELPVQKLASLGKRLSFVVAQALTDNIPVVSADAILDAYGIARIW